MSVTVHVVKPGEPELDAPLRFDRVPAVGEQIDLEDGEGAGHWPEGLLGQAYRVKHVVWFAYAPGSDASPYIVLEGA